MSRVVATIEKNRREKVQVTLNEYQGHNLIDLRIFADNGVDFVATKKGVSLRLELLPNLIEALRAAESKARGLGLLPPNTETPGGG